jgi:hypothetical protein
MNVFWVTRIGASLICGVRRLMTNTDPTSRRFIRHMPAGGSKRGSFLTWASHCLPGHIVLFLIGCSLPCFAVFLFLDYSEGISLTIGRVTYLAVLWAIGGLVIATLGWYTVSLPLIKTRGNRRD